jgi:hypothetical protein
LLSFPVFILESMAWSLFPYCMHSVVSSEMVTEAHLIATVSFFPFWVTFMIESPTSSTKLTLNTLASHSCFPLYAFSCASHVLKWKPSLHSRNHAKGSIESSHDFMWSFAGQGRISLLNHPKERLFPTVPMKSVLASFFLMYMKSWANYLSTLSQRA